MRETMIEGTVIRNIFFGYKQALKLLHNSLLGLECYMLETMKENGIRVICILRNSYA